MIPPRVSVQSEIIPEKPYVCVVYLSGEIDMPSVDFFNEELDKLIKQEEIKVYIFDLENLRFINSTAMGIFAKFYTDLQAVNKKMAFARGNENVLYVLGLIGILNLIDHFPSLEEAALSF